jgi:hypothetical protein
MHEKRVFDAMISKGDRHSGERRNPVQNDVRSTRHKVLCASHDVLNWMIRFAHPSGAILRMFSALRAPSGVRRNDEYWI